MQFFSNVQKVDNSTRLGFVVNHLDQLITKLEQLDVIIIRKPWHSDWGYTALIQDLDGRKIELTEGE